MNQNEAEVYFWWDFKQRYIAVTPEGDCWQRDAELSKPQYFGRFWWVKMRHKLVFDGTMPLGDLGYTPRWRWRHPLGHFLLARAIPAVGLFMLLAHLFGH